MIIICIQYNNYYKHIHTQYICVCMYIQYILFSFTWLHFIILYFNLSFCHMNSSFNENPDSIVIQ